MGMRAGGRMTNQEYKAMLKKRYAARRILQREAIAILTKAGWSSEKIEQTLRISTYTIENYR